MVTDTRPEGSTTTSEMLTSDGSRSSGIARSAANISSSRDARWLGEKEEEKRCAGEKRTWARANSGGAAASGRRRASRRQGSADGKPRIGTTAARARERCPPLSHIIFVMFLCNSPHPTTHTSLSTQRRRRGASHTSDDSLACASQRFGSCPRRVQYSTVLYSTPARGPLVTACTP